MEEPQNLSRNIAELLANYPPGHRLHELGRELARAQRINAARLAAILKHPDLAAKLTEPPIGYRRASQWNGWIPPAIVNVGESEMLRMTGASGIVRWNQRGLRTQGEIVNDSTRRLALVELAQEAWRREHEDAGSR